MIDLEGIRRRLRYQNTPEDIHEISRAIIQLDKCLNRIDDKLYNMKDNLEMLNKRFEQLETLTHRLQYRYEFRNIAETKEVINVAKK
jgi:archaellum component FlaC